MVEETRRADAPLVWILRSHTSRGLLGLPVEEPVGVEAMKLHLRGDHVCADRWTITDENGQPVKNVRWLNLCLEAGSAVRATVGLFGGLDADCEVDAAPSTGLLEEVTTDLDAGWVPPQLVEHTRQVLSDSIAATERVLEALDAEEESDRLAALERKVGALAGSLREVILEVYTVQGSVKGGLERMAESLERLVDTLEAGKAGES